MSGRIAIIGLTTLAFLAVGAGTSAVPTTASAEFRVPGLFTGKKVVKRKRSRRARPVAPIRNPDRTFAAVSTKAVSPDVAKNSQADLAVGTVAVASLVMALPAPTRVAEKQSDSDAPALKESADETAPEPKETAKNEAAGSDSEQAEASETESAETDEPAGGAEDKAVAASDSDAESEGETDTTADAKSDAKPEDETPPETKTADAESAPEAEGQDKAASSTTSDDVKDTKPADIETAAVDEPDAKKAETAKDEQAADDDSSAAKTAEQDADKAEKGDATESAAAEADSDKSAETATADDKKAADTKSTDGAGVQDEPSKDTDIKSAGAGSEEKADSASADAKDKTEKNKTEDAAETAKADGTAKAEVDTADADGSASTAKDTKPDADSPDVATADDSEAKDDDAKTADAKETHADDADSKTEEANDKDGKVASATEADSKDADTKTDTKADADNAKTPASEDDAADGEIVTASLPPAPEPKPEIARMISPANTPERQADTESDAQVKDASSDGDGDVTASIAPASKPDGIAASNEAADVTDIQRATTEAPSEEIVLDPRAYDAIVVLDVSPPPGAKADGEDTKLAALKPGTPPLAAGKSGNDGSDDESVELGPPPPPPVDPVIKAVRTKLEGASAPKLAAADVEALKALYGERDEDPLWVADDSLAPKAKTVIATIRDANDWGLDARVYATPSTEKTLTTDEARAEAELAVSAAVLKYARHAQTGRLKPSKAHKLFDFHPKARDPKAVLTEIAGSGTPDKTLLSLHPQNDQYQRLHAALVHARDSAKDLGRNPDDDRMVQLIVLNMERWRWLPSDLGSFHVWNNIPEFKFRVLKNGREIYEEKSIVGQAKYATAFFSSPMRNIVFNPNWTVPPTIVREDIAPKLRGPQRSGGLFGGRESRNRMLRRYGLKVSRGGKPVDADQVDWQSANVHAYTFQQDPGPHNVLGRFKFNFPNKHAIYMHDTTQKELFGHRVRTLSHGCIRVNQPTRFAAFLLAEDKGWSMGNVQDVFARAQGETKVIALRRKIPVHMTYNTAIADGYGSIREFGDVYGIDSHMAAKLFKNPAHFNVPIASADFTETTSTRRYSESRPRRPRRASGVDDFLSGLLGN
ncbi:MAG: L,D-transpeptidase family protein [Methyloceanibacter sp.]|nr:L,D-transpeptidase family protein [Methyloceanibacter sp.]